MTKLGINVMYRKKKISISLIFILTIIYVSPIIKISLSYAAESSSQIVSSSGTITYPEQYTLLVSIDGAGYVTRNPNQATYEKNDVVQLTATPDPGYSFTGWSGYYVGTENPIQILIEDDTTITAHFTQNLPENIVKQIESNYDNVWYYGSTGWRFAGNHYIGCDDPDYNNESVAYRWNSIEIPKEALIISAKISLYGRDYTGSSFTENIYVKGLHDTGPFTDRQELDSIPRTQSEVSWRPDTWGTSLGWHETPDISSIIQELVDEPSWDSGNTIAITISSFTMGVDQDKAIIAYNQQPENAPKITIEYEVTNSYVLETNSIGNGQIDMNPPNGRYTVDSVVEIQAIPDPGWRFSR